MEVIRNVPADRPHIQRYQGGGFKISGVQYDGAVLVTTSKAMAWPVTGLADIDSSALIAALKDAGTTVCLFGCGERMVQVPGALRQALKDLGIGADSMATGAACRTYNMLSGEGRAVAAVLLPLV
jgi:uncharacterized protein